MKEKKPYKRFPISVRESAMQRMKLGVNVSELARQLGVDRTTLYWWKRKLEKARAKRQGDKAADVMDERDYQICELESKIAGLEGELGRAEMEKRFFEAALRRIEESRQKKQSTGGIASSPRSATGRTRKAN
jgi:transposase-like protein